MSRIKSASSGLSSPSRVAKAAKASMSTPTWASAPGRKARSRPTPGNRPQPAQHPGPPQRGMQRFFEWRVPHGCFRQTRRPARKTRAKKGFAFLALRLSCLAPGRLSVGVAAVPHRPQPPGFFHATMSDSPNPTPPPNNLNRTPGDANGFNWRLLVLLGVATVILGVAFLAADE